MASEIEAAAERVMRIAQHEGRRDVYGGSRTYQRNKYSLDLLMVAAELTRRLAADRAEREERARQIDAEWLESLGFTPDGVLELGPTGRAMWGKNCGHVWLWGYPDATCSTRGQLLDLLRALKGGA